MGFECALKILDAIVDFLASLINLGKSKLVVFFSFLILKLEITAFSFLLERLILLPVLNTLLEPLFHEASIPSYFIDLSGSHLLKHPLTSLPFLSVTLLRKQILSHLLIIKLFLVTLHEYLLLRLVENLQSLMEECVGMLLILFLSICQLHCWAVISKCASYMDDFVKFAYSF